MSKGKVTVLGSNGHLGNAAMVAFQEAGWAVTGLGRSNRRFHVFGAANRYGPEFLARRGTDSSPTPVLLRRVPLAAIE